MNREKRIDFDVYTDTNGFLIAYESNGKFDFAIQRVFTVHAKSEDVRGEHAHLECSQLLVCISGKVEVLCDDGVSSVRQYALDSCSGSSLLIPPNIWSTQKYVQNDSVLMVLCSHRYDPNDYIRDYVLYKRHVNLLTKHRVISKLASNI
jgi:UDP-2-acetamido-3-amino-2,3-dideoxy-glucuronate N-acetyltransferase